MRGKKQNDFHFGLIIIMKRIATQQFVWDVPHKIGYLNFYYHFICLYFYFNLTEKHVVFSEKTIILILLAINQDKFYQLDFSALLRI